MSAPRSLKCPGCGGTVAPPLGSRRTICEFCRKPFFYTGEDFLPRYAIAPRLEEREVQEKCRRIFRSRWAPANLSTGALLLRKHRSYLPFYLLTGKRGGVMETGRERINHSRDFRRCYAAEAAPSAAALRYYADKPEVSIEEDSRVVLGDFRYLYPAVTMESWDIRDVDLKDPLADHLRDAEPARLEELAGGGEVVDADLPLERIVEKGVASSQGNGDLKVLEMQAALVYVPILTLTFRYGSQVFSVILDELEGTWLGGRMPFRRDIAFLLGLAVMVLLGTSLGKIAGLFITFPWEEMGKPGGVAGAPVLLQLGCMGGVFLAVVVSLGLSAAWGLIRAPYHVRLTPKGEVVEAAGPVPQSPLRPVNTFLVWLLETFVESQARRRGGWN